MPIGAGLNYLPWDEGAALTWAGGTTTWELGCAIRYTDNTTEPDSDEVDVSCPGASRSYLTRTYQPPADFEATFAVRDVGGLADFGKALEFGTDDQTTGALTIMPEGAGAGLPAQVIPGLRIKERERAYWDGAESDPPIFTYTIRGKLAATEPPWAAQV